RREAAGNAHAHHELVGRLELAARALGAHVAVVLLVEAVEFRELRVVLAQRAGERIREALHQRAAQVVAALLERLDGRRCLIGHGRAPLEPAIAGDWYTVCSSLVVSPRRNSRCQRAPIEPTAGRPQWRAPTGSHSTFAGINRRPAGSASAPSNRPRTPAPAPRSSRPPCGRRRAAPGGRRRPCARRRHRRRNAPRAPATRTAAATARGAGAARTPCPRRRARTRRPCA